MYHLMVCLPIAKLPWFVVLIFYECYAYQLQHSCVDHMIIFLPKSDQKEL